MIEAMSYFNKNVTAFIDGSLDGGAQAEFEAFLRTHPEYLPEIENKQAELDYIKSFIPQISLSKEANESLSAELKQSVFLLVRPQNANVFQKAKMKFEEWVNR
ncbi:MAG: hypothetical protein ACOVP4_01125 [Bacteriovoracaceae bacterium]|jgi:hypothetical protein